ncbi:MAG: hypothetical protein E6Q40_03845 [Cupriavidus sp.]|nr:MAG: hypothetical protein E6Q40_03845 [Cupriavidus sp.]
MDCEHAQRTPEPIHAEMLPVCHYAEDLASQLGERRHVVRIPEVSTAFAMGFRYGDVEAQELGYYEKGGARTVYTAVPAGSRLSGRKGMNNGRFSG